MIECPPTPFQGGSSRIPKLRIAGLYLLLLSASAGGCSHAPQPPLPESSGTVRLNQEQLDKAPGGGGGIGSIFFKGATYPFSISGAGISGEAVAIVRTQGEAYRLNDIGQFEGTYRHVADSSGLPSVPPGGLWLRNERGVLLHLDPVPQGRLPDIATDAVRIVFSE